MKPLQLIVPLPLQRLLLVHQVLSRRQQKLMLSLLHLG
jgi:hypothetical protein